MALPQPESKVQPIRLIEHRQDHEAAARAGGIDDLVEFGAFYTRDILLQGAMAGPEDGEPVIMLHGFPDFWLSWARQVRPLVEAGYRVIIPDQRGYNLSEKPANISDYAIEELGADITDLLDALKLDRAHLVGHDWGGAVAWWLAENHPHRFHTVSVLNCPHYDVLVDALKLNSARQMLRSWYIAFFQLPFLPEKTAGARNHYFLEKTLRRLSGDKAFSDEEIEAYRKAWGRPEALRSMINWYRASRAALWKDDDFHPSKIAVPLQVIWGEQDLALDTSLVEPSIARCEHGQVHWVPESRHWVQRDCPEFVTEKLLDFFASR